MRGIHLSSTGYFHGQPRPVSGLDEVTADAAALAEEVVSYRVSDHATWELAAMAAERTLERSRVAPDLMLYVTEGDPTPSVSAARIVRRLGLGTVDFLTMSGHDCGNLGPALRVAADALHSRRCAGVLLVLADRGQAGQRVTPNGLSVFSDGAASCILTREAPAQDRVVRVDAVSTRTEVTPEVAGDPHQSILSLAWLAAASVADVLRASGLAREDFQHVVFANYRTTAQRFLTAAMKVPTEKLLPGPVADYGHCFSADILVTLDRFLADGTLTRGSRVLAVSIGPYSWSTIAVTCVPAADGTPAQDVGHPPQRAGTPA